MPLQGAGKIVTGELAALVGIEDFRSAIARERFLKRTIDDDRYPLSPRVTRLREILAKLRPEPVREPLPPRKVYAPPRASAARRRR